MPREAYRYDSIRKPGSYVGPSKRQERVGKLVLTELSKILQNGKTGKTEPLDKTLRQRISIVSIDVSPDLKQARVSVSVRDEGITSRENNHDIPENNDAMDKRQAISWLVRNSKSLRHLLAKRMSHIKFSAPTLQFVRVDVGAAVDVMYLIDKISSGKTTREGHLPDGRPKGISDGVNFDEDFNEDNWEDEDT